MNRYKLISIILFLYLSTILASSISPAMITTQVTQVKIGIDGLTHAHVHGLLSNIGKANSPMTIVGIAESNKELAMRLSKQYGFDINIVYNTIEEMIEATNPQGVMAFNSIYAHLSTVEACAPKGIHVMVEKPLAVNSEHAQKMATLSRQHKILLLTNYETTWYASNHKAYEKAQDKSTIGDIRKVIVCDGHEGPKEIGCSSEFLDWLCDPVLNGGGAVVDFGCYGANLMTWLMKNQRPTSVSATLQQMKPDIYPNIDDEATIILTYPKAQAIIQASWNWPFSRKDIEIYGANGYVKAPDDNNIIYRPSKSQKEELLPCSHMHEPYDNPFSYFAAAIRGDITVDKSELSSLENNVIVVEILDAAKQSAKTGKVINF